MNSIANSRGVKLSEAFKSPLDKERFVTPMPADNRASLFNALRELNPSVKLTVN